MERKAEIARRTAETDIRLAVNLDGTGVGRVSVGIGFFQHMLELFAKHSLIDLEIEARGDLHVDPHHTVEDVGICLGIALGQALGSKEGIQRYGHAVLPMEECLVTAAVDLGGRPYFVMSGCSIPAEKIGEFPSELLYDFWQAIASHVPCNLHVVVHYGRNSHHLAEGIFKAAARAFRQAVEIDPRRTGVPSTKGVL